MHQFPDPPLSHFHLHNVLSISSQWQLVTCQSKQATSRSTNVTSIGIVDNGSGLKWGLQWMLDRTWPWGQVYNSHLDPSEIHLWWPTAPIDVYKLASDHTTGNNQGCLNTNYNQAIWGNFTMVMIDGIGFTVGGGVFIVTVSLYSFCSSKWRVKRTCYALILLLHSRQQYPHLLPFPHIMCLSKCCN